MSVGEQFAWGNAEFVKRVAEIREMELAKAEAAHVEG